MARSRPWRCQMVAIDLDALLADAYYLVSQFEPSNPLRHRCD